MFNFEGVRRERIMEAEREQVERGIRVGTTLNQYGEGTCVFVLARERG